MSLGPGGDNAKAPGILPFIGGMGEMGVHPSSLRRLFFLIFYILLGNVI